MIPIETVFMVSEEAKLDKFLLERLEKYCYSKVPVYAGSRTRVVGYIKLKNLLGLALDGSMIKETKLVNQVPQLKETDNLLEAIDVLKGKNTSIAVVVNEQGFATGVLPLKNIF